jgi:kynurenine formamidase
MARRRRFARRGAPASASVGAMDPLAARVVDLTHALTPDFPLFPVYDPVEVRERFSLADDGFFVRSWRFDEHCGTHVDAPAHFGGEATVEQIPAADLLLNAVVIDVRERVARDDDALVVPDDVLDWERRHGPLPERACVLALTGWGERAGDAEAYLNADGAGVLHTPGFSGEVAAFLRDERPGVRAIGIDTASLDVGASTDYPAHGEWLPSGRYGIENVARLGELPPSGALVVVGAPTFGGGSGGPARILALA